MDKYNKVTGVMVQYFYTCKRELWFYANRINMNYDDDNIHIGRQIQDTSYDHGPTTKDVLIDGHIAIDVIEGENTVYEVKKSDSLEEASIMQLKYYLWYLKEQKGIEMTGVLAYPTQRDRKEITLSPEDEEELAGAVDQIRSIIAQDSPPAKSEKPFCESCSFYDL